MTEVNSECLSSLIALHTHIQIILTSFDGELSIEARSNDDTRLFE